jgi:cyclophilin family peptidyl-prolyl cis-trans isomerase/protein-disulfide isomerase
MDSRPTLNILCVKQLIVNINPPHGEKMKTRIIIILILISLLSSGCTQNNSELIQETEEAFSQVKTEQVVSTTLYPTATRQPGCTVRSQKPTPNATHEALLPAPADQDWTIGPNDAYVTIIEYSDFQCPACATFAPVISQLHEHFGDDLKIVYRHFPLSNHDKAQLATQASEAAGLQDKFWEMHDLLFKMREEWIEMTEEDFSKWLIDKSYTLGLDVKKFETDLNSQEIKSLAKDSWENNAAIGMPGTPFIVINNYPYNGPLSYSDLTATVEMILLERIQYSECPTMTINPEKQYFATIETEKGDIVLELFPDVAPLAVNNFVFLSRQGWYENVSFHRVIPGFVAQAGDPSGTGFGGPGYAFDNEVSEDVKFDSPGIVAMANAGPGSNGSQFFITYSAVPRLNGNYSIFGRVISGMTVVENLIPRDPSKTMDLPPGDKIIKITIEEK